MKRCVMLILILAASFAAESRSQQEDTLTLDEAIRIGRQQSHLLKASVAKAEGADAKAREAGSALLPSIKIDGSYRRLSSVSPFTVSLPFPGFVPIVIQPFIADNYQLHAGIQQPLFTGFRLSSNAEATRLQADAGALDSRSEESDLVVSIATAYWTLYQSKEVQTALTDNVARLEQYERDTKNLLGAGLATKNDLLRVQVQLQNARLSLIDAENDEQIAQMNLNIAIGRPAETPVALASSPTALSPDTLLRGSVTEALKARPDVAAQEARVHASGAAVTAARGGYFPQIALSANYYYSKPNQRYFPLVNQWKDSWDLGVQLQLDVWNWGATAAQTEQAEAALAANKEMLAQMEQTVSLDVQRSLLSVRRAREKVDVARLGVSQAEENSRMLADKYHSGLATSTELLDANVALVQAKTALSAALVEQAIAGVRLEKSLGRIQ